VSLEQWTWRYKVYTVPHMPLTHGPSRAVVLRWLTASALLGGVLSSGSPAVAAAKATPKTVLHVHSTAASFHVGAPVVLAGTVAPSSLKQVTLERLVGKKWVVIAHAKPSAKGAFTFTVKGSKARATWPLRVVRAKSTLAGAGVSGVLKVHIVKAIFTVTATTPAAVSSGARVIVTGKVSPKTAGTVWLQALSGKTWKNVVSAKLSKTSNYVLSSVQPAGVHRLRVVKAATTSIAGGTSAGVTATVSAALIPPPVVLTVAALPQGTAELPYQAQLVASGGTAPYLFAVTGLPTGLLVSASGAITGSVPTALSTTLTITVVDAANHVGAAAVPLVFALSPYAANVVVGWGSPHTSQTLGTGVTQPTYAPILLPGLHGIIAVAGSDSTGYALRFDGTVLAWGTDNTGSLGDGGVHAVDGSPTPLTIAGLSGITAIGADGSVAMALRNDGTVWAWGDNFYGQVGDGTTTERDTPVQVTGLTGVTSIAVGANNGYALKSDGTVWAWGQGNLGALGDNSLANSSTPVKVVGLIGVSAIAAHSGVAAAVNADGVWDWGLNSSGQLGNMSMVNSDLPVLAGHLTGVTAIAVGGSDSYAIEADGSLWAWGANNNGQLGVGDTNAAPGPVKVHLAGVTAVSAGAQSVTARLDNGSAWSWGSQALAQLGDGLGTDSSLPVQVSGLSHVVGLANGTFVSYAASSG
jgi:alpha-tubulin suppressor-like RCC1 family protein